MKKLLSKAKSTFQDNLPNKPFIQPSQPSSIGPPTPIDLIRYRYHHGVNLGSIFVLEQWLHNSMFPPDCPGSGSEHDAVTESLKQSGLGATRQKWEAHWRSAISDSDFEWLVKEAHCTSIRLPIGYFTLGAEFCRGTPFEGLGDVYVNAWNAVRELVARARSWGIGVLLDFHALPGGANGEAHSGTSSGRAEFFGNRKYMELGTKCLVFMARGIREGRLDGVIGLQLVNEAPWDAKGMYEWYEEVINEVSQVDDSIPIYISDGWDLARALGWANGRRALRGWPGNPVIIDTHKYYTFSESDRNRAPQEIIRQIGGELEELNGKEGSIWGRGEAQIVIGEWSCVLDGRTWSRVTSEEKDGLVRQFGRAQSQKWQERAGGSYFWTYKMDWMDGGEWGFAEQTKKQNISAPSFLNLSTQEVHQKAQTAHERRQDLARLALGVHENYWNQTCPGQHFEHDLYYEGFHCGFSDAQIFFTMRANGALGTGAGEGGDKIGCLDIWVKKRLLESGQRGEFTWEWEQGLRAGIVAFYDCVGI